MKALEKLTFEFPDQMLIKNLPCRITNILINHLSRKILALPVRWTAKIEDSRMLIQGMSHICCPFSKVLCSRCYAANKNAM